MSALQTISVKSLQKASILIEFQPNKMQKLIKRPHCSFLLIHALLGLVSFSSARVFERKNNKSVNFRYLIPFGFNKLKGKCLEVFLMLSRCRLFFWYLFNFHA
jgi:hypothetical protein